MLGPVLCTRPYATSQEKDKDGSISKILYSSSAPTSQVCKVARKSKEYTISLTIKEMERSPLQDYEEQLQLAISNGRK